MRGTLQTPNYSPHPAEPRDPGQVIEDAQRQKKGPEASLLYPLLPWSLEDLPGTTWRHLPSGLPMRIDCIGTDEDGRPLPIPGAEIVGPDEYLPDLGSWWNDRFCIEHWVRVDHLPPPIQLAWFGIEIAHRRAWAAQLDRDWFNQKYAQQDLAVVIRLARAFAGQHGLSLPPDLLPVRTFPKSSPRVQESLGEGDVHLVASELAQYTFDLLLARLSTAPGNIVLDIACPSANELTSPWMERGAQEYLLALYVGETIAECCEQIAAYAHRKHVSFVLRPRESEELARKLLWLAPALHHTAGAQGSDGAFRRLLKKFASTVGDRALRFPALGDKYLEYDMDSIARLLCLGIAIPPDRKRPERSYGFWRSGVGNTLGVALYLSQLVWILPRHEEMARLLLQYETFQEGLPHLYEATLLEVKDFFPIVYHRHRAVRCSLDLITNAQRCAEAIERAKYNPAPRPWEIDLRSAPEIGGGVPNSDITNVLLSANAELLVATDALARYIVFKNGLQAVSPEIVRLMLKDVAVLSSLVAEN